MTRFYLALVFSVMSLAGFGLILYGILARPVKNLGSLDDENVVLGFSESTDESAPGLLDFNTGYEGLKHKGKEPFDPEKHKPEPIESKRKLS